MDESEQPQEVIPQNNNAGYDAYEHDAMSAAGGYDEIDVMARKVLEEIATVGTSADVALDEYIKVLAEYRRSCEDKGNYREAELVQHVLKHLKLEEESRHVRALTEQQEMERQGLEEAHLLEFQTFNRIWNERIDAFEERQLDLEASALERHSMDLAKFHAQMTEQMPRRIKFSKDLLNLRNIQETLAKQKSYAEAQKIKERADQLEQQELEDLKRDRGEVYKKKESQILARHRNELLAMRKRMERGRLELERSRKRELEMLLQRYNNVKRGLEGQQNIIKAKTGNMLLKHSNNRKTDSSGSAAIITSVASGTFGVNNAMTKLKKGTTTTSLPEVNSYRGGSASQHQQQSNPQQQQQASNSLPKVV
eukprot:PhM_4_TR16973/c0_g1_i1/m.78832